ncbi:MAG: hypothetical protein ACREA0_14205, partial [bacterium]
IRDFVAVGDTAGAQGIIMQEVSRQTAGAAAAEQDAFEKLKDVFDNMAESLAALLLPTLEVLANVMAGIPGPVYLAVAAVGALALAVKGLWGALTLLSAHPIVAAAIAIGVAVVALEVKFGVLGRTVHAIRNSIQSLGAALSSIGSKIRNIRGGPGGLVGMFRGFHGGGIVPGPSTQQHLAVLRGGERVLPHSGGGGGGGVVVNVAGSVVTERDLIEAVRRGLVRSGSLPSRGRF